MQTMRRIPALLGILALSVLGLPSCSTNTQGDDASPVFLTVSFDLLPIVKNVNSGSFLQFQTTTIKNVLKVPSTTTVQFLDVRLESYTVSWSRLDGGKSVPSPETFAGTVLVPANGTSTLTNYPYLSIAALQLPPFNQLFPFNGGVDRETNLTTIRLRADVAFFGRTLSGQTATGKGNFEMTFYYNADPLASFVVPKNDGRFRPWGLTDPAQRNLFLSGLAAIALR
jgi:hypothetical protein